MKRPTPHPVLPVPGVDELRALGEERFKALCAKREAIIRAEKADPIRHGWESPMWRVCDALLGIRQDERILQALGGTAQNRVLLIQGGNRSGKSEYAAKRVMQCLIARESARAWCFHSTHAMSVEYQQSLCWKYMPIELRKKIRSETAYISYTQKYGFSDDKFVLPNRSECTFRNYEQDVSTIEGGEVDVVWVDELVPPDWVETLILRTVTRAGMLVSTFTPIRGYTATVKMFLDGATPLAESPAWLCPRDRGAWDDTAALTLGQDPVADWMSPGGARPVRHGRAFERVPRVMRALSGAHVVYFHCNDNPYGNPQKVIESLRGKPETFVRERYYGVANKTMSSRFPKFGRAHIVSSSQIPTIGTRYLFVDPSSGRNFFMAWFMVTPEGRYLYREWPGQYEIPEIGVPGAWAVPDGKKHDGKRGEGQNTFGYGILQYKREIARLEGWKDVAHEKLRPADWRESRDDRERICDRFIDSRFSATGNLEAERPVTLIEEFERVGLYFRPTPGVDIDDGVALINDALDYDPDLEIGFFNKPKFYICDECRNAIYALQNWTGLDGEKGACKDPVDVVRYFLTADCQYVGDGVQASRRGGYY